MDNSSLNLHPSLAAKLEAMPLYKRRWFWAIRIVGAAFLMLGLPIASYLNWQNQDEIYIILQLLGSGMSLSIAAVILIRYLAFSELSHLFIGLAFLAASASDFTHILIFMVERSKIQDGFYTDFDGIGAWLVSGSVMARCSSCLCNFAFSSMASSRFLSIQITSKYMPIRGKT